MRRYYTILNSKENINARLLSGISDPLLGIPGTDISWDDEPYARSHRYLRDKVFNGNIVDVLKKAGDVVLIYGTGFLTRSTTAYTASNTKGTERLSFFKNAGDGTVLQISASAADKYLTPQLPYQEFNLNHSDLIHNEQVFTYVRGLIDGSVTPERSSQASHTIRATDNRLSVSSNSIVENSDEFAGSTEEWLGSYLAQRDVSKPIKIWFAARETG
jgi:hypothetical protein